MQWLKLLSQYNNQPDLLENYKWRLTRQLAICWQEIEAARARAQSYDGTNVELANVRPTTHTQTIENQATGEIHQCGIHTCQAIQKLKTTAKQTEYKYYICWYSSSNRHVKTQSPTVAYGTLLNKANDERTKKSKQEKGIQAEAPDFPLEVQQLNHQQWLIVTNKQQRYHTNIVTVENIGLQGTQIMLTNTAEPDDGVMIEQHKTTKQTNGHQLHGTLENIGITRATIMQEMPHLIIHFLIC